MPRPTFLPLLLLILLAALSGCAEEGSGAMDVRTLWTRPTPQGAQNAAFYMTVANNTGQDDALVEVRVEACGGVELHRTSLDEEGVMRMEPVPQGRVPVPEDETVVLEPGGLHVMCLDVAEPLTAGQRVPMTVVFERAGEVVAEAEVRTEAP